MRTVCVRLASTLLAGVVLTAVPASAQTTTADGVQAILRGDYDAAVRILRPLSETAENPDPLAQFFMASLYEAGHGVARDPLRACGLYLNAAKPESPLGTQALDLARAIQDMSAGRLTADCVAAAAIASSPAPPQVFVLSPEHSVTIDEDGATVRYRGAEKLTRMSFAGALLLPARHTVLDVSRPVAARRHFIETFLWVPHPDADPPVWTLGWVLHEVVGVDFVPAAGEREVAAFPGLRPPARFDLDRAARVAVRASGEVEWTVMGGPNPRNGIVPSRPRNESRHDDRRNPVPARRIVGSRPADNRRGRRCIRPRRLSPSCRDPDADCRAVATARRGRLFLPRRDVRHRPGRAARPDPGVCPV